MLRSLLTAALLYVPVTMAVAQEPESDVPAADELRQWTDTTGKFQIDAIFVNFADDQVTLQRDDGSTLKVPLARLSAKDRAFVRAELRRRREAKKLKDDPPKKNDVGAVNDRRLGILPLEKPRAFVHVEGMPVPSPEECVRARWSDPEKDPQLLVNAEAKRLETAGERHMELEKKFNYGLTRVETHHMVIHAQLPPAEARKVGLALEAMKLHLQQLTGSMALSQLDPAKDEVIIAYGKDHYLKLLKIIEVEKEGQLGRDWPLMKDLMGGYVGNTGVQYVLPNFEFTASHMAVNQAAGQLIQKACNGQSTSWLAAGFMAYCENVVMGKNIVQNVKYDINVKPIGPNWAAEAKRLARERAFKPWDKVFHLDLRDFEGADYLQAYAMVAYLIQTQPQKFLDYTELLGEGGEIGPSLEKAYGHPIAELQVDWVRWLMR